MKSLDINSASTNLSVDASQRVTIEFTGGNHFDRMQGANTVTVPYSSLSKRMQAIHRFGGKITNITFQRLQLDLPRINSEVDSAQYQEHVLEETPAIAPIVEPEKTSEIIPEISVKDVSADISSNIPKDVPENIPKVAPISTSKTQKPLAETTVKPKKSKDSTKASHGFSKKEASPQSQEPVAIAEIVSTPESIVEIIPEIVPEPISEQVLEKSKPPAEAVVKPKKSKTSTKAGHGFSKKEASPQSQEPVAIAEIFTVLESVVELEPVVEVVPEIVLEQVVDSSTNSPDQDPQQIVEPSSEMPEHVQKTSIEDDFEATGSGLTLEPVIELDAPLPLPKSKKSKTSSKAGSGFNKPKSDTQTPRSQRKPKS